MVCRAQEEVRVTFHCRLAGGPHWLWEENQSGRVLLFVLHAVRQGDGVASVKHNRGRGRHTIGAGIWFIRSFRCGGGCMAGALRQSHTCGGHVYGSGHGVRGSLSVMAAGKAWLLGEGTGDQASTGASGMGGEDRNRDANEERGIGWRWEMCHTLAGTLAPIRAGGGPPPHLAQRMRCTRGCYPHFSGCSPSEGPC